MEDATSAFLEGDGEDTGEVRAAQEERAAVGDARRGRPARTINHHPDSEQRIADREIWRGQARDLEEMGS